ncbi:hypothetical protein BGZ63DRAFT_253202 [Mariannaea sp. PMI_226]|nr:hypothetical protein BGZ63DRAFT_253202 [Mariannaea sp. PMI_226]
MVYSVFTVRTPRIQLSIVLSPVTPSSKRHLEGSSRNASEEGAQRNRRGKKRGSGEAGKFMQRSCNGFGPLNNVHFWVYRASGLSHRSQGLFMKLLETHTNFEAPMLCQT